MTTVLEVLEMIEDEKVELKVEPTYTLYRELIPRCMFELLMEEAEIADELNKLYQNKQITVGKTINDKYIRVV